MKINQDSSSLEIICQIWKTFRKKKLPLSSVIIFRKKNLPLSSVTIMVDSKTDPLDNTGNLKDLILEDDVEIIPEPESQKNLPKFTKISKQCFTYNRKCYPSIIAFTKHSAALKNWFSTVFGIDGKSIKKGVEVSNEDANNIIQYMLKKKVGE